ncbi:TPA: Heat-labile enterotoxin IIA, A chain [Escherichia coli]|nr:Heat-labile enterotoxin IIA, A chain [Escherichia coli]HBA8670070.1 Heat-labile enterotoxin IIA, A chain [Escherichia coli]HBA8710330.1 Heat-labile enterotoxin IIA, A chain [Escherichia coli]
MNYKSIILFFILNLCFGFAYANNYYRADSRTPDEIRRAGGILSRGQSDAYERGTPININLFNHASGTPTGNTRYDDGYVSTTNTVTSAHNIGQNMFGGLNEYYIYVIAPAPNMFNVNGVLGRYSPHPYENEFAALGGIPVSQIIGWYRISFGVLQGDMTRNPEYRNDLFRGMNIAANRDGYRLAGFPDGHRAWHEDPWREFAPSQCHSDLRASSVSCQSTINLLSKNILDKFKWNLTKRGVMNKLFIIEDNVSSYSGIYTNVND